MKARLATTVTFVIVLTAVFAVPISAAGATVDRLTNVETVLAVRMDDDFPIASLMRADCSFTQLVTNSDGSAVETMHCRLSDRPVMIPEFQGQAPDRTFIGTSGPCLWASDYWFFKNESIVLASSVRYTVTPSGVVNVRAEYPAEPLDCEE